MVENIISMWTSHCGDNQFPSKILLTLSYDPYLIAATL